jgi:hypothetical protein
MRMQHIKAVLTHGCSKKAAVQHALVGLAVPAGPTQEIVCWPTATRPEWLRCGTPYLLFTIRYLGKRAAGNGVQQETTACSISQLR